MASPGAVVPAQLGFLAIFNPSLGNTDETIDDQIVYYASANTQKQKRRQKSRAGKPTEHVSQDERNERLRQIGLAQGMVDFGKSFSGGRAVDTIDTEKSRVILNELEPNWWILASIDLTRVPLPPKLPTGKAGEPAEAAVEYSSKEIQPAPLMLEDLLRAHNTFLLHHDSSLSSLFVRSRRKKFVSLLTRYWDLYLSTWNVMLHDNPIRSIFGGINIGASGELGMGVGEEERGSGEREVLEGLVGRIEGLVDLVVSKFGSHDDDKNDTEDTKTPWLGTGREPGPNDGAIFLGTGALSRKSLRDVTHWMEDLYIWGENAYGVIDSPTSSRQARKKRYPPEVPTSTGQTESSRPPIRIRESSSSLSTKTLAERRGQSVGTVAEARTPEPGTPPNTDSTGCAEDADGSLDKLMSYMKLGYGTYWSIGKSGESSSIGAPPGEDQKPQKPKVVDDDAGHYLIGLLGDVEDSGSSESDDSRGSGDSTTPDMNTRTMLRTLHVELEEKAHHTSESNIVRNLGSMANEVTPLGAPGMAMAEFSSLDQNKAKKLRVVVYVNKPFIFTFLFELRTDSLAWDALYKSLHHQLAPLRQPLLASTAYRPARPDAGASPSGIYDVIWDPAAMTVHSSVPNIPGPGELATPASTPPAWSRAEATNTHMQMINIYSMTRADVNEVERTCKTNRGWWVVWARILEKMTPPAASSEKDDDEPEKEHDEAGGDSQNRYTSNTEGSVVTERAKEDTAPSGPVVSKEIFLVRRASDHAGSRGRTGSYAEGVWSEGTGKLGHGIGVDTRKYIESLLSVDR